jgi:hypothetical protein
MMDNITYKEVSIGRYEASLSKLVGKSIKDVIGYFSSLDGTPSFKVTHIIFADDSEVGVEGEHDFPYIVTFAKWEQSNLDEDTLERLDNEQDATDDIPF